MLTIRPIQLSDSFALLPIYGDQQVCEKAGFFALNQTQINELLPELLLSTYVIMDGDELVGIYTYDKIDETTCSMGFILKQDAWHRHIILDTIHLFLSKLNQKGFNTIYADCLISNVASKAILEKARFHLEAEISRPMLISNEWLPCYLFKYVF